VTPAAVAVIRAAALRNNLQKVREAAPGCPVLAVIKANAYGHGLVPVAHILEDADAFAVARLEEALQLRESGVSKRIVVLGGFIDVEEAGLIAAHRLDAVIHSLSQVAVLEEPGQIGSLDLWIKVDTGMGRLGIEPGALSDVLRRLLICPAGRGTIRLMTHLASADERASPATSAQLSVFDKLRREFTGDISIANSAAILQWPMAKAPGSSATGARNWVRPGLMLYGVSPLGGQSAEALGLQPAMSFESRLISVRHLARGCRVGYGGDWQAQRDSVVGVAAAGYADGYPWHSARSTPALVNGQRVPVIGRVSMDMISLDLTDLAGAKAGDRVVLWGDMPAVEEIAAHAGTIPYELLAGMSPRVIRQVEDAQKPGVSRERIPS
jgi:alanine racemase